MHACNNNDIAPIDTIAVDIIGAAKLLSCGQHTARKIVKLAGARIDVPGRRALYATQTLIDYVLKHTIN